MSQADLAIFKPLVELLETIFKTQVNQISQELSDFFVHSHRLTPLRGSQNLLSNGHYNLTIIFQHAPGVASAAPALDIIHHSLILFYTLLPILSIAHVAFATLL